MIAATIFLDSGMAFWTLFSITLNPVGCFTVIVTFLEPFFQILTEYGLMWITTTFETVCICVHVWVFIHVCMRKLYTNQKEYPQVQVTGAWSE